MTAKLTAHQLNANDRALVDCYNGKRIAERIAESALQRLEDGGNHVECREAIFAAMRVVDRLQGKIAALESASGRTIASYSDELYVAID